VLNLYGRLLTRILNADVGGNFQVFKLLQVLQIWRAEGVTTQQQLYCIALVD
jgi:hypothetical protein